MLCVYFDWLLAGSGWNYIPTLLYIYRTCSKHVEVNYRNELRVKCATWWFSLQVEWCQPKFIVFQETHHFSYTSSLILGPATLGQYLYFQKSASERA
jgi:hypothetical protein